MNHTEIKQRLLEAESVQDVAAIVREGGQELTEEQADRLFQEIQQQKKALANPNELDNEELETVTGGYSLKGVCKGTIEAEGWSTDAKGRIKYFETRSRCWFGADYCSYVTETYDDYNVVHLAKY